MFLLVALSWRWLNLSGENTFVTVTPEVVVPGSPPRLAVIEAATDDIDGEYPVGREFFVDDRVRLDGGSLTLRFPVGVLMEVSGPAEMEFVSPMKTVLHSGRLTATVEEPARGFTIVTPGADIVDLGTRFGVHVGNNGDADMVVFEGSVEVHYTRVKEGRRGIERLSSGEALRINSNGKRISLIVIEKGAHPTGWSTELSNPDSTIARISDNFFIAQDRRGYYGVVPGGFDEDAISYVDRPYEWNSLPGIPFPEALRGGDYVQMMNDLKFVFHLQIQLELRHDADVFVLMDERVTPPQWLRDTFELTEYRIGMDECRPDGKKIASTEPRWSLGEGPGASVDGTFHVWKRHARGNSVITFGGLHDSFPPAPLTEQQALSLIEASMYGIVLVPANPESQPSKPQQLLRDMKSPPLVSQKEVLH